MLRRGRRDGWANIPVEALQPWAAFNSIRLDSVKAGRPASAEAKGAGLYASKTLQAPEDGFTTLMTVPRDLILSKERIEEQSKADRDLRALLESLGEFGQTPRIHILSFLLSQVTILDPSHPEKRFVRTPFTTYIQLLPAESLPSFWSEDERSLLRGTTLSPAVTAKLNSLYREYDRFRECASTLPWCEQLWFDEVEGLLSFDDWLQVDAMYRSRALEFPGIGDCMAPCIDMANHASGDETSAIYEVDGNGDAVLLLRPEKKVAEGEEVTITYGDAKGACEMIFSYGFLEDGVDTARELLLDLEIPDDDPLRKVKVMVARCPPGVKIIDTGDAAAWESDFIWMICVNEEDGLEFKIERTTDGEEDIKAVWKESELSSASHLKTQLMQDPMWDLYRLRAASLLQDRVAAQLTELYGSDDEVNGACKDPESDISERTKILALKLRRLESELLEKMYSELEEQKESLMKTETVVKYLTAMNLPPPQNTEDAEEEDFS